MISEGTTAGGVLEAKGGSTPGLVSAALSMLDECGRFVDRMSDGAFVGASRTIAGGTLGKHLRHLLDHYDAALRGAATASVIDYDHRERDVTSEHDRGVARARVRELRDRLCGLSSGDLAAPVRIRVMLTSSGDEAELGSTLGRELAFATHHAIHHCAMMRAIAAEFGGECPEGFGKAPSTLHHERTRANA